MMQKLMSYKKLIIGACAAVVVIVVAAIVLLSNKEETFRSIMVYDVEGNAVIERETVGAMDAAENLYLESGDRVSVAADSSMRMKLDDDKYVMAEADTVFSLEAEGTEADSRTKICLEQGAITNEIRHPLSEGSQYETSTPNSVMAVRGTIYRVELCADENGGQDTKLCCFQGKVGAKPILPDGTYGEEILVPAGSELTVYEDGTVGDVREIAYDELPAQAVQNLMDMLENGQSMTGISLENLAELVSQTEDGGETPESRNEQAKQSETAQGERSEQAETAEPDTESVADRETEAQIQTKTDTAKNTPAKPSGEERKAPAPQPSVSVNKPSKPAEPANGGSANDGNTEGDGAQDENSGKDSDGGGSDKDKKDKDKPEPAKPKNYTVTFRYQGKVFATQTVKSGETVAAPALAPAQSGAWDFDFGTKIKANTTISWK